MAEDVVRKRVPPSGPRSHRAPLGIPLESYKRRLKPGRSVLLDELKDVEKVRVKWTSVNGSLWARRLFPGYRVVPSVSGWNRDTGRGDLWLSLVKNEEEN